MAAIPLVATGLVLLPVGVLSLLFDFDWVRLYCMFSMMVNGAALLTFLSIPQQPILRPADWWIIALGGGFICLVLIGGMMMTGSSAYAILDAAVLQGAHVVRNWYFRMPIGWEGVLAAGGSFVTVLAYLASGSRPEMQRYRDLEILVLKSGFVILGLCLFRSPVLLVPGLLPFCWLFMVAPAETDRRDIMARGGAGNGHRPELAR